MTTRRAANVDAHPQRRAARPAVKIESLDAEAHYTIEEARMVLPGIQAIFGFQLIAVFNQRFHDLSDTAVSLHLTSLILVALSIALIMAPAAYHRIAEPGQVSRRLIDFASRLISIAMLPLMIAIAIELWVITELMSMREIARLVIAGSVIAVYGGLWFAFPWLSRRSFGRSSSGNVEQENH